MIGLGFVVVRRSLRPLREVETRRRGDRRR